VIPQYREHVVPRQLEVSVKEHLMRLVLASASPRRAELLRAAGIPFDVVPADVDERLREGESPSAYVRRVAIDKARTVHARRPNRIVLAADTTVVVDDQILAKPDGVTDAGRMLRLLSGRAHEVMTGVALASRSGLDVRIAITTVEFAPLTDEEIAWYIASGESADKAGGYGIQGLASRFVTRIEGSYSNVVGLPVAIVYEMVKALTR
jgi:septum formation protein